MDVEGAAYPRWRAGPLTECDVLNGREQKIIEGEGEGEAGIIQAYPGAIAIFGRCRSEHRIRDFGRGNDLSWLHCPRSFGSRLGWRRVGRGALVDTGLFRTHRRRTRPCIEAPFAGRPFI